MGAFVPLEFTTMPSLADSASTTLLNTIVVIVRPNPVPICNVWVRVSNFIDPIVTDMREYIFLPTHLSHGLEQSSCNALLMRQYDLRNKKSAGGVYEVGSEYDQAGGRETKCPVCCRRVDKCKQDASRSCDESAQHWGAPKLSLVTNPERSKLKNCLTNKYR
jgi:hypothetical protein